MSGALSTLLHPPINYLADFAGATQSVIGILGAIH